MKPLKFIYTLARVAGFAAGLVTLAWRAATNTDWFQFNEDDDDHLFGKPRGGRRSVPAEPGLAPRSEDAGPGADSGAASAVGHGALGNDTGASLGGGERLVRVVDGRGALVSSQSTNTGFRIEPSDTRGVSLSLPSMRPGESMLVFTEGVIEGLPPPPELPEGIFEAVEPRYLQRVMRRQQRHMPDFRKALGPYMQPDGTFGPGSVEVATEFWSKRGVTGTFVLMNGGVLCGMRMRVVEDVS